MSKLKFIVLVIQFLGFLSINEAVFAGPDNDESTELANLLEFADIDEGKVLYKGFQPGVVHDASNEGFGWYTEHEDVAKLYRKPRGLDPNEREILEFKSTEQLQLVKIDFENISMIKSRLAEQDLDAFDRSFPTKEGKLLRNSTRHDRRVAEYLCNELGFDGYYAEKISMADDPETFFHGEFLICKPHLVLEKSTPEQLTFDQNGSPIKKRRLH
ncbi:MAG: hypothetical protein AB8G05_19505 [Oligoflexales bacterium]